MKEERAEQRMEQRMEFFLNKIEGCTDEDFARFERIIMERRGRATAPAIVALIGAALAQPINPRSRCLARPLDLSVCMEESTEGKV